MSKHNRNKGITKPQVTKTEATTEVTGQERGITINTNEDGQLGAGVDNTFTALGAESGAMASVGDTEELNDLVGEHSNTEAGLDTSSVPSFTGAMGSEDILTEEGTNTLKLQEELQEGLQEEPQEGLQEEPQEEKVAPVRTSVSTILANYSNLMGDTNAPSDVEIKQQQRMLANVMLSCVKSGDVSTAQAKLGEMVNFITEDENSAFTITRVLRGVGRRDIFKTVEESNDFRMLITAVVNIANPNLRNSDMFDWTKLRDILDLDDADGVVNLLRAVAGENRE